MKSYNYPYRPNVGERCLVSPPNCDDDSGYVFSTFEILWANETFVLYGNEGHWPNLNKWDHVAMKPLPTNKINKKNKIKNAAKELDRQLFYKVADLAGIGIGANNRLIVLLKTDQHEDEVPSEFMGYSVDTDVVGEIEFA